MKLSIITISYNAENVIGKTIESVIRQTIPIYEYVFIDGNSTDNTNSIIESYRETIENSGIRFIHISEPDKGISDAFNKGIMHATGDYIGIINADDELLPNAAADLQSFINNSDADVVYGNCIWLDEVNNLSYICKSKKQLEKLYYDMVVMHSSTFVSKDAYDRNGLFNTDYKICMDQDLLLRMYIAGEKFAYIDKEFSIFRAGGVSDNNVINCIKERIEISNAHNRPKSVTYIVAAEIFLKNRVSCLLKKTKIYRIYKKAN